MKQERGEKTNKYRKWGVNLDTWGYMFNIKQKRTNQTMTCVIKLFILNPVKVSLGRREWSLETCPETTSHSFHSGSSGDILCWFDRNIEMTSFGYVLLSVSDNSANLSWDNEIFSQVPSDGADGCQLVPGDSDGAGPRENVLPALPDVVWYQTSALSWHYSQGKKHNISSLCCLTTKYSLNCDVSSV